MGKTFEWEHFSLDLRENEALMRRLLSIRIVTYFFALYCPCRSAPEDASLQCALRARYLRNKRLYEYGGVIPFGDEPQTESEETV